MDLNEILFGTSNEASAARLRNPWYIDHPLYHEDIANVPEELAKNPHWRDSHGWNLSTLQKYIDVHNKHMQHVHETQHTQHLKEDNERASRIAKYEQQHHGGTVLTEHQKVEYKLWEQSLPQKIQVGIHNGEINGHAWFSAGGRVGNYHHTSLDKMDFGIEDVPDAFHTPKSHLFTNDSMYASLDTPSRHYDSHGNIVEEKHHKKTLSGRFWDFLSGEVVEPIIKSTTHAIDMVEDLTDALGVTHYKDKKIASANVKHLTQELESGRETTEVRFGQRSVYLDKGKLSDEHRSAFEKQMVVEQQKSLQKISWIEALPEQLKLAVTGEGIKLLEMMNPATSYGEIDKTTAYGAQLAAAKEAVAMQREQLESETIHAQSGVAKKAEHGLTSVTGMLPMLMVTGLLENVPVVGHLLSLYYMGHGDAMEHKDKMYEDRERYMAYGTEGLSESERRYANTLLDPGFEHKMFWTEVAQDVAEGVIFKFSGGIADVAGKLFGGAFPKVLGGNATHEMAVGGFMKQLFEQGALGTGDVVKAAVKAVGTKAAQTVGGAVWMSTVMTAPVLIQEGLDDLILNKPQQWSNMGWWKDEVLKPFVDNLDVGVTLSATGALHRTLRGQNVFSDAKLAAEEATWRSANRDLSPEQKEDLKNPAGRFMNIYNLRAEHMDLKDSLTKFNRSDLIVEANRIAHNGTWDDIKKVISPSEDSPVKYKFNSDAEKEAFVRAATVQKSLLARADDKLKIPFTKEHEQALIIKETVNKALSVEPSLSLSVKELMNADSEGRLQEYKGKMDEVLSNLELTEWEQEKFSSFMLQKYKAQLDAKQHLSEFKTNTENLAQEAGHEDAHFRAVTRAIRANEGSLKPDALARHLDWELEHHKPSDSQAAKLYEYALCRDIIHKADVGVNENVEKLDVQHLEDHLKEFRKVSDKIREIQQTIDEKEHDLRKRTEAGVEFKEQLEKDDSPAGELTKAVIDNNDKFVEQTSQELAVHEGVVPEEVPPQKDATFKMIDDTIGKVIDDITVEDSAKAQQFVVDHVRSAFVDICKGGVTEGVHVKDGISVKIKVEEGGIQVTVTRDGVDTFNETVKNRAQALYSVSNHLLEEYYNPINESKPTEVIKEKPKPTTVTPLSATQNLAEGAVDKWNVGDSAVVLHPPKNDIVAKNFTISLEGADSFEMGLGNPSVDEEAVAAHAAVKKIIEMSKEADRVAAVTELKETDEWKQVCAGLSVVFDFKGTKMPTTPFGDINSPKALAARNKFIEDYVISGGDPDVSIIRVVPTTITDLNSGSVGYEYENKRSIRQNLNSNKNKEIIELTGGEYRLTNSKNNNNVTIRYGKEVFNGKEIAVALHRENLTGDNVPGLAKLIYNNLAANSNLMLTREIAYSEYGIEMSASHMLASDVIKMFINTREASVADVDKWSGGNSASRAFIHFEGNSYYIHDGNKIVKNEVNDVSSNASANAMADIQLRLQNRGVQVDEINQGKDIGEFKWGKFNVEKGQVLRDGYGELLKTYTRLDEPFKNVDIVVRVNNTSTPTEINRTVIENKAETVDLKNLPQKQEKIISTPKEEPSRKVKKDIKDFEHDYEDEGFRKGSTSFTGVPDSYTYDGWVKSVGVRLMSDFLNGEELSKVSIKDAVKLVLESGDGLKGLSKEIMEKGVNIRGSLLHGIETFTTDVAKYMKTLDGIRLNSEKIGDADGVGESYRLMISSDKVDPYAKTNARLLGVMSTLRGHFDPGLTTERVSSLGETKNALMTILGGNINSVEDILPALLHSGEPVARDFHDRIKDDYDLQIAAYNTFKVNHIDFQNVSLDLKNGIRFSSGEGGHFRHQITEWNRNLADISADQDIVQRNLATLEAIRSSGSSTFDEFVNENHHVASLAGVHVSPETFNTIAEEYYNKIGCHVEYMREGYNLGGEAKDEILKQCLDQAIKSPELLAALGHRGGNLARQSEGLLPEVAGALNHATNQTWKYTAQRGDRSYDLKYDTYHNYNSPGIARLNILSTLYGGESPLFVTDAKGDKVYIYQQPTYVSEVISRKLQDVEYLDSIVSDPMYSQYYYVNHLRDVLNETGSHDYMKPTELLTLQTPTGRKAAGDITSSDNALLRYQLSQELGNKAMLRQASDKSRITFLDNLPDLPQQFVENPAEYIRQTWVAGEARSLLQAMQVREQFKAHVKMDLDKFKDLTFAQQEQLIGDKSLRNDFGMIEGYHYRYDYVKVGDKFEPRLHIEGSAYEPRLFPFLSEMIHPEMTADELALKFVKSGTAVDGSIHDLIDLDLRKITREYVEFLADQGIVKVDRSLLQEGTYGTEMIVGSDKIQDIRGDIGESIKTSVLKQIFNSVELDALFHGDQALYGTRVNQIKRIGGEYSTVTKFATDFPNGHELSERPTFKVYNAHDLVVATPEAHEHMLNSRVGNLEHPSKLLQYNLDAAKNAESTDAWGHRFFGKSEAEVLKMTLSEEGKVLDIMKKAVPTDGQSMITPKMAREMSMRLGLWSAEKELAYNAMINGEDPTVWGGVNMFNTFKCMYWGADEVQGAGLQKTGYVYNKTAYAVLDMFGSANQKELIEWMDKNDIGVLSYGSATKVFGSDKAEIFNKDKITPNEAVDRYTTERNWQDFGYQVPNEPHAVETRKLGVQITKDLIETASPEVKTELHKVLAKIQKLNSNKFGSTSEAISSGLSEMSTGNTLDLAGDWDSLKMISPKEIGKSFFNSFSDALETKTQGSAAVLISSAGVFETPLKFRDEHGYAEGVVNSNQVSFIPSHLTETQKQKMFKKGSEDLEGKIEAIVYRIPTQGTTSAEVLNIKDIVHNAYGDRIYVPHELSSKDGHDNDNDKAFVASKTYRWEPKNLEDWERYEDASSEYLNEVRSGGYYESIVNSHKYAVEHQLIYNEEDGSFYRLKGKQTFDRYLDNVTLKAHTDDNSVAGLGNQFIDGAIKVLRDDHGSIDNTNTVDGVTQLKKDVISKYAYIPNQEGLAAVSPVALVKEREISTGGSDAIAAFAHGSSMKCIFDKYIPEGHYFTGSADPQTSGGKTITFYGEGKPLYFRCPFTALNLEARDGVRTATGGFINSDLTALVSMVVDAVKDPVTYYGNINKHTAGIVSALMLEGHGDNALMFAMQPALREFVREQEQIVSTTGSRQDAFKNALTTLAKHYDPNISSETMIHSLLESKVQERVYALGDKVMSSKFLGEQLTKYREYQEQGVPMAEWGKNFLLDQMVISTYAATADMGAKALNKYLVFNDIDSGKINSVGSFHRALTTLISTEAVTGKAGRYISLDNFSDLEIPDKAPYWEAKGIEFLKNASYHKDRMGYVLGDNVLSSMNNIINDNMGGRASSELRDKLHSAVVSQMYSHALHESGVDIGKLIKGKDSVLSQWNELNKEEHIDPESALHKFLKTDNSQFSPDGKITRAEIVTIDVATIRRMGLEGDFMNAISEAADEIKGTKGKNMFKNFIHDLISLQYISDGNSAAHLFPSEFVKNHEALKKASTFYDEGLPEHTELIQQAVLRSVANDPSFNMSNGLINRIGDTYRVGNRTMDVHNITSEGVSEFSWDIRLNESPQLYLVLGEGDHKSVFSLFNSEEGVARYHKLENIGYDFGDTFVHAPADITLKNEGTGEINESVMDNVRELSEDTEVEDTDVTETTPPPVDDTIIETSHDKSFDVVGEGASVTSKYFEDKTDIKGAVKVLFENRVDLPETFDNISRKDYAVLRDEFEKFGVHLNYLEGTVFVGHETHYEQNIPEKINSDFRREIASDLKISEDKVVDHLKKHKDTPEGYKAINKLLGREENDPYFKYLDAKEQNALIEHKFNC